MYHTIKQCGFGDYYRLRDMAEQSSAESAEPARVSGGDFSVFDDASFQEQHAHATAETGIMAVELYVEHVHCGACVWLIERLPRINPGVVTARLDLRRHVVRIEWNAEQTSLSAIAMQLDRLGYTPHPFRGSRLNALRQREDRGYLIRIGVAGAIAGNVMLIAFALYGGMFHGMKPAHALLFEGTSLVLTALSLVWPGSVFFRSAVGAARARRVNMDVPVTVGLLGGFAWSCWSLIAQSGDVYFDSITTLIFLLLVGRWIQVRQQRASYDAVEQMFNLTPSQVRRVDADGGRVHEVTLESVEAGDLLEVRAGESIPVDGVVSSGRSDVNLALLTGESIPVAVDVGAPVHAGTTNCTSRLVIETISTGEDTRLGRLMHLVEEYSHRKAHVVRIADRVAAYFVCAVLGLAIATLAGWWFVDPSRAVAHTMSLLIITCPCALGLATPLALVAAIGRAARRGILIKGGDALEALARPGTILLDKTGTLTRGEMSVVRWIGDAHAASIVAAVEAESAHPVAQALVTYGRDRGQTYQVSAVEEIPSCGIRGMVDGQQVSIGNRSFVRADGAALSSEMESAVEELVATGASPVYVGINGTVVAVAGVGDPIKPGTADVVQQLHDRGWSLRILSGDHPDIVRATALQIGLDPDECHGGLSPEEKVRMVEHASADHVTVMVGDGVNDAAALAAASVGIAVRGGAEASLSAADAYLSGESLEQLVEFIDGSGRAVGVIRRNLIVSLCYNIVGSTLAIAGLINPLVAAVLMPASSLTVITMSFRSRTFGDQRVENE